MFFQIAAMGRKAVLYHKSLDDSFVRIAAVRPTSRRMIHTALQRVSALSPIETPNPCRKRNVIE